MSRYPLHYPAQHIGGHTPNAGALLKPGVVDDRESQSPSDDGSGFHSYTKDEVDLDDDPNHSLITQTLNTDGTPKRPMNAFMIFARRRRPQVSAENQSMRTGEISKILSKEWNQMELSEKQFYLDQAKQLKDIFNSKYPDYVYRRRPNNSRRKRRPDTVGRNSDNAHGGEPGDESGNPDFDDISPTDVEDPLAEAVAQDLRYGRLGGGAHPSYDTPSHSSRTPSYAYSSEGGGYRQSHGRMPYPHSSHRGTPDLPLESSGRVSQPINSNHGYPQHSYPPSHHTHSPTMYDETSSHSWDAANNGVSRSQHSRTAPAGWISGATDRPMSNLGIAGDRGMTYPQVGQPPSSWARATSPGPRRSSGATSPSFPFPTLNSPFFPNQSQMQGNYGSSATSSSSSSIGGGSTAPQYHSSGQQLPGIGPSGRSSSGYDHRSYTSSPSPSEPYPHTSHSHRDLNRMYQQHPSQNPSSASMSPLTVPHLHSSSNTTGYWSRDKTDPGH